MSQQTKFNSVNSAGKAFWCVHYWSGKWHFPYRLIIAITWIAVWNMYFKNELMHYLSLYLSKLKLLFLQWWTEQRLDCQSWLTNTIHFKTQEFTAWLAPPQHKYLLLTQKLRCTTEMSIYLNAVSEVLFIFIASQNIAVSLLVLTSSVDSTYTVSLHFKKVFSGDTRRNPSENSIHWNCCNQENSVNSTDSAETAFLVCLLQS